MKAVYKGYVRFLGENGCIGIRRSEAMKQTNAITTNQDPESLARLNDIMQQAGPAANEPAARVAFDDHTARIANEGTAQVKLS